MHELRKTGDGSNTLYDDRFRESLHSGFGALTESRHIFIENGFMQINKPEISILEIGFGTGLNAALTLTESTKQKIRTQYYGIEKFPPDTQLLETFYSALPVEIQQNAENIRNAAWNKNCRINAYFNIYKEKGDFLINLPDKTFDLVYFDPFSPEKHPQAWEKSFFYQITDRMAPEAILMTYSSKGIVKQALRQCGLYVKRLAGPPGKRHILQARKFEKH